MTSGRLDPEMIKDMAKIMNEAIKGKVQVNLVINNRAGGNAPLIGGGDEQSRQGGRKKSGFSKNQYPLAQTSINLQEATPERRIHF